MELNSALSSVRGIELRFSSPLEALRTAADKSKLDQILNNLIHNAIKYSPDGSVICIDCQQQDSFAARGEGQQRLANDPNYQQWASIKDRFPKITIPSVYLYGMNDVLGPVENGFVQEDLLPNVQMFYPNECGHQGRVPQSQDRRGPPGHQAGSRHPGPGDARCQPTGGQFAD